MSKEASKLSRCIKAPIRALSRARDFYVRSMTGCAGRVLYGAAGDGYPEIPGVPRSYSYHLGRNGEEDLRELIRAASQGRSGALNRAAEAGGCGGVTVVPRSQSVAVGRIDEDQPCDFKEDVRVGSNLLFPRSRSCGVALKRVGAGDGAGAGARMIA